MENRRARSVEVELLCALLDAHYLSGEVAERVGRTLRDRLQEGAYASLADDAAFAHEVSKDTVGVSGDLHLVLRYSRAPLPVRDAPVVPESGRDPRQAAATGHGFVRVERLPGNIGMVDIRRFWPLSMSRHAAVGAMHLAADTEVLIFDLRNSGGGEPEMVAFLCSYLFDTPARLSDLYFPRDDVTIEWWTDPAVPGPVFGAAKPVFVLTSSSTISAAEGFAYDLQQWRRAAVIGWVTAGAANFDYRYRVGEHLTFSVPSGYPVNPVSGTGWEGTGVQPDIVLDPADAGTAAYRLSLEHVVGLGAGDHRAAAHAEPSEALARLTDRPPHSLQ
jgi:C-terminal processing protease CtpA/Prc